MPAVFIAGTDTGIGKTHAACALLHALRRAGHHACGMKPVASGCVETADGLRNDDALALQAASSAKLPYASINPVALRDPLSPHLAAAHDGVEISLAPLRTAFDHLQADHRCVVVEGVGGWLVPLAPRLFAADIAKQWRLPVILVVGLRLGCLNHALLSARGDRRRRLPVAGLDRQQHRPDDGGARRKPGHAERLLPSPCLGVLPHGVAPESAAGHLTAALAALG